MATTALERLLQEVKNNWKITLKEDTLNELMEASERQRFVDGKLKLETQQISIYIYINPLTWGTYRILLIEEKLGSKVKTLYSEPVEGKFRKV